MNFAAKVVLSGTLALMLVLFFSPPTLSDASYTWDWSSEVNFGLSALNTKIMFDGDIYLGSFTFVDGLTIIFNSILLDSHVDSVTLGTSSANMTVTYLAPTRLDYNVTGAGTQTINLAAEPDSVVLDGVSTIEGMGYSYNDATNVLTVTGASEDAVISFLESGSGTLSSISTGFTDPLFQYILNADLIGFVFACYTSTIGSTFYAVLMFFVSAVIYIRQKSLFIVSLLWLFLGGSYITLFWEFSSVAVLFTVLGVAGIVTEFILVWRRGH